MDTVEELNGTYFYDGISNLSPQELLFWVMIDEAHKQLGIKDIVGLASIILGNNIIEIPGKPITATRGTSPASLFFRKHLSYKFRTRILPTLTKKSFTLRGIKIFWVNNLGAFAGKAVPVLGWSIMAADVAIISFNAVNRFTTIDRSEDKIW
ncbi:STM2901 family protein [Rosenbergiella epipactidis]|uniref:STM2901 family protein n=1 Tax=Rosenbergiella epipactidis TaxID=1544694 RepID=UPI001F4D49EA|nr:hypothetical protein [Rosenbergiella epipactidis]